MRNDPILMHYGVKGMKWRKRKSVGLKAGIQNASKPNPVTLGAGKGAEEGKKTVKYTNLYNERHKQLNEKRKQASDAFNRGIANAPKPKVSKEYEEEMKYNSKKNEYPKKNPKSKIKKKK